MSPTLPERFRAANDWAFKNGYFGGWPTCYDGNGVHGIATVNHGYEHLIDVRNVKHTDLGSPSLNNTRYAYRSRLTTAHDYARRTEDPTGKIYDYGRPNFHMAEYGDGIVCGTFFYRDGISDYQDVTTEDLGMDGNPEDSGNQLEEWFERLHLYAVNKAGYATGIPNGHYANYGGWVIGSILFHRGKVTVHSVPVSDLNYPTGGGGGTVYVTVPDVVGETYYPAREKIEGVGLKPVWFSAPGVVITATWKCMRQEPRAGTRLASGRSVALTFEPG